MTVDSMWRKNRRTQAPNSNHGSSVGVDINRNYDFLWEFKKYFSHKASVQTSTDPSNYQVYNGPSAFSEPETKNVKWVFDNFPNIRFFIDLHSFSKDILYNWGDDDDQTTDPSMNFQNHKYDGLRGITALSEKHGVSDYKEYIPPDDLSFAIDLANTFRDGIQAVRGTTYTVKSSYNLYPTSGASDDYAYSRNFVDSSKEKVLAFVLNGVKNSSLHTARCKTLHQRLHLVFLHFASRSKTDSNSLLSPPNAASPAKDEILMQS